MNKEIREYDKNVQFEIGQRIQEMRLDKNALSNRSDFMPEDIQTLNKGCVRFKSGYIPGESEIREAMDRAMIMQFNLLPVARKMVLEELEMKQNG